MRSKAYYRTRTVVRFAFWSAVMLAAVFALQMFIVLLWSLQF